MADRPSVLDGLRSLARRTPPDRDRYVDFLRALSIGVVVLGHWLIAVVTWEGGSIEGANALEVIPGLWAATWVLQVMPLFFFVGGFSNLKTVEAARRDGLGYADFLRGRMLRMLRPTVVFLGIGTVVTATLDAANVADNVVFPVSELVARPLWFLGVYMIVVALAPAMAALHRRFRWWTIVCLAGMAILVDLVRFGFDIGGVGYVNYPVVWLFAHQLGFLYADGALSGRAGWRMAGLGLATMTILVAAGPYPGSMVGLSTDEFSNMDPPTIVIGALCIWQVGAAMVARAPVTRWLQRAGPWMAVAFVNSVIMTVFLWHLAAMVIGVGVLYPLGFPQPAAGSAAWWALRPAWVAVLVMLLAVFVGGLGRFEQRGMRRTAVIPTPPTPAAATTAIVAVTLVVLGVLGFALGGMHQVFSPTGAELIVFRVNPFLNVLHLLAGSWFLGASVRPPPMLGRAAAVGAGGLLLLVVAGAIGMAHPDGNLLAANAADIAVQSLLAVGAAAAARSALSADSRSETAA